MDKRPNETEEQRRRREEEEAKSKQPRRSTYQDLKKYEKAEQGFKEYAQGPEWFKKLRRSFSK
jgi:hypothetical protein